MPDYLTLLHSVASCAEEGFLVSHNIKHGFLAHGLGNGHNIQDTCELWKTFVGITIVSSTPNDGSKS